MYLHKTELARATLAHTNTELGRRERQVLILCDGERSLNTVVSLLGVESLGMIQSLIAAGYLVQEEGKPSSGKGLFGRLADGVRAATTSDTQSQPAVLSAPAPVAAPAPAPQMQARPQSQPQRPAQSRRSMAACKMYMLDMLQLQRTPEAASLSVALQTAQDDDERAVALVDALDWLRTATKASVCERVAERLLEIIPEIYLAGLEAAWKGMNPGDQSNTTDAASNVVQFGVGRASAA